MMQIRLLPRSTMQVLTRPAAPAGLDGWTPVFAVVVDGLRRVQQVINWTGGRGEKPMSGWYVGASGLVDSIALAVDIRGEPGDVTPAATALLVQVQAAASEAATSQTAAAGSAQQAVASAASAAMAAQNSTGSADSAATSAQNADISASLAASSAQAASTSATNAVGSAQSAAESEIAASLSAQGAAASATAAAASAGSIDVGNLVARANNLSDLADKNAALANLGGGATGVSLFKATTATAAKSALGRFSNADIETMPADTLKGRLSSVGEPQDLTATQAWGLIGPAGRSTASDIATGTDDSKFVTPAGLRGVSGWRLVQTIRVSTATAAIYLTVPADITMLRISGSATSSVLGKGLLMSISTNNGASYYTGATDYLWAYVGNAGTAVLASGASSMSGMLICGASDAPTVPSIVSCHIIPGNGSATTRCISQTDGFTTSNYGANYLYKGWCQASSVRPTNISLSFPAANLVSGTFLVVEGI